LIEEHFRLRLLYVGLAAAVALAIPAIAAASGWSEVRNERVVLRAREGFDRIDALACDVERVAGLLSSAGAASSTAAPMVVAVDRERDARELLPQFWEHRGVRPVGAYWAGPYGHHIVVRVNTNPRERLRRILHEYAHFTTHLAYPDAPPWLDEGLSELWTNAAIDGDAIEIGSSVDEHVKTLRSAKHWIPIAELVAAPELPSAGDAGRVRQFYAEAWALAHYLALEKGQGLFGVKAASQDLPTDEELQSYVRTGRFKTAQFAAASDTCTKLAARLLTDTETLMRKAQMLADGERPEAAVPLLQEALRKEPGNTKAAETLAVVDFTTNRPRQAAEAFDRLIAEGSASFLSYYYRALLATPVPLRSDGTGPVPVAEYLAHAVRLNPAFEPARERLGELQGSR
jgi:tetratricopeptide (TPR) repeat protein